MMTEQQMTDRFREAVADEPPLGFDPDEVIDRAIKRGRRRTVVVAVAAATCVEAVAAWALASLPGGGSDQMAAGGGNPGPARGAASAEPTYPYPGAMFYFDLSRDRPVVVARSSVWISAVTITNVDRDRGSVQLKRADVVLYEFPLDDNGYNNKILEYGFVGYVGVPVSLVVHCESSARGCQGVSVRIAGSYLGDGK
jgi:hypothetical protein